MSEKKVWKVAVIGCGAFANWHYLGGIPKEANAVLVATVDIIPDRAEQAAKKYGAKEWYKSVYELIENCDFDIAIDSASIQAHHEINMAVLNAGKHLISQKPAAPNVKMLTEQMELAKSKGVGFVCVPIHPQRYDLNVAKQIINDGGIGTPTYIKCNTSHGGPEYFQYRDADPSWFFDEGAGALVDMGVHGLQVVTTMFGPAKSISCTAIVTDGERTVRSGAFDGKKIKTDKMPDQYLISIIFRNGKMGFVDTGFAQKATKCPNVEIYGTRGTISITKPYMLNNPPEVYIDSDAVGMRGWIEPMAWVKPPKKLQTQCCCLYDLIDSIENGTKPALSPEHARHVLEIMCKIPEAIKSGKSIELETTF